ncbi:MAG: hypothetical protein FJ267_12910 [Planctomycetes bacterium]|nr:hypothetical protein [Planctomycetota bacterium]
MATSSQPQSFLVILTARGMAESAEQVNTRVSQQPVEKLQNFVDTFARTWLLTGKQLVTPRSGERTYGFPTGC